MKVLILNQQQVRELLTMQECMMVMDKAFLALAAGEVLLPLRQVLWLPGGQSALAVMPSFSGDIDSMGVKVISVFPQNLGTMFDSHQGAVLLFDTTNGCLQAILDATEITAIRTAAVSGVATRALARSDAGDLAILGSGVQARTHLQAMLIARKIRRIRVWSRNLHHAERFAQKEGTRHDVKIEACENAIDAVKRADIICTVTSSRTPVLFGEWIEPGAHINAIGTFGPATREVDTMSVVRSSLFVDRLESAIHEAGDYLLPLKEGSIREGHIRGELAQVLSGSVQGRTSPEEITLFKSLGLAVEDLACAHYLHQKAVKNRAGTFVELGGRRHDT
jgi:alanine dehydrogenase